MKVCAAQTRPVRGDIQANIENHKKLIDIAVYNNAEMIVFPELSLTGYEPTLARELAIDQKDGRLVCFQKISNARKILIAVGVPLKSNTGILISMMIFQPDKPQQVYSKQYLHDDEIPYFTHGYEQVFLTKGKTKMGFAICYEISVPEHSEKIYRYNANIYIASVAKFVNGIDKAIDNLSGIAKKYSMVAIMSNCIGQCDGQQCAGRSSVWNNKGESVGQLNDNSEGILMVDTATGEIVEKTL